MKNIPAALEIILGYNFENLIILMTFSKMKKSLIVGIGESLGRSEIIDKKNYVGIPTNHNKRKWSNKSLII